MSTWKKILTEEDGNLATTDLTQSGSGRNYTLASNGGSNLNFVSGNSNTILQLVTGIPNAGTDLLVVKSNEARFQGSSGSLPGRIALFEATDNGSYKVGLSAPNLTQDYELKLPTSLGNSGDVLQTDGSGNLSFAASSSSDTHLGNANLTADDNRTYDQDGNDLTIDPNGGQFEISDSTGSPVSPEFAVGQGQVAIKTVANGMSINAIVYPDSDGTTGQALTTNGSGTLSFSTVSGGTIDGSGGSNRIAIWSDSDTLTSDSEITYTAAANRIEAGAFTASEIAGNAFSGMVTAKALQAQEINVGIAATTSAGLFGTGSRLLKKGGSFQGTLTAGRVMRYSQGQGTNPITTADHTSEAAATTMLFCTTDAADAQELLLNGIIKMASNQGWNTAAQGTPLYLGSSSGLVQASPPTTTNYYSRIIGYVISATNSLIYFSPSQEWIKIS